MSGKTELIENRSALTSHTHTDSNVNFKRYIAHEKSEKKESVICSITNNNNSRIFTVT